METASRQPLETLADAAAYLDGLINRERRPNFNYERLDLRPIRELLDRLGRPEDALSVIHVAGSKGKGSTCLFAESILMALGERVGCFTSPHLESWVERFRIDGRPVAEAALVEAVRRIRPIIEDLRVGPLETRPSFFDATTAAAFLLFAEAGVDRALIEVGLGGRLDSTNVVHPAVTCIASIELEHTDKLGNTEAAIAGEKAGILKPKVPIVLGTLRADAARVIRARAEAVSAPLLARGEHFSISATPSNSDAPGYRFEAPATASTAPFTISGSLSAPGLAAIGNAGLAIACVRALAAYPDAELARVIPDALRDCALPARIEILANDPVVIVDAAHTAESARALAATLRALAPDGFELLLSVSSDKNLTPVLDALLPGSRRVWVTRADPTRSLATDVLAKSISQHSPGLPVETIEDPFEAARRARTEVASGLRLCAAGSIYLAGIVRQVLGSTR